jgi:Zn-dependent oligopeptidase
MIVQKLWNNNFNINTLKKMIDMSVNTYNSLLISNEDVSKHKMALISFLSDDIYEFDSIARFSKTMIDLGIEQTKWFEISQTIKNYNNQVNKNIFLFDKIGRIMNLYDTNSEEYKFLSKVIEGTTRNGVNLRNTRFNEVNEKISFIENKLMTDFLENCPIITLETADITGLPTECIAQYYDKTTQKYNIKLDKKMYVLCNKYISQSSVRHKIDDVLHEVYQKNIVKLVYLFIYKHVKANMLNYKSYLNYLTHHTPEYIQNILSTIITQLNPRCELETKILSDLKQTYENDNKINTWDISYYTNKWKIMYGVNENDISPFFEVTRTLNNVIDIISQLFQLTFIKQNHYQKWDSNIEIYKIIQNKNTIGEVTFDLYERSNKIYGNRTICISNRCKYPNEHKNSTIASIIVCMSIPMASNALFTLNDLSSLFNEFGKVIYYVSCVSNYSLFGGMYSNVEMVDAIGKFTELLLFNNVIIKKLSYHHSMGTQLSDQLIEKIIHHKKLDYGLAYKYQCLYGLYDLFVHSQIPFIEDCKKIMKNKNLIEQKNALSEQMNFIYNTMYSAIFNSNNEIIHKENNHFHPVLWTYLFNGNENTSFLRILSDMYAHELYSIYNSKQNFCPQLIDFISKNTLNKISFDYLIGHQVSIMPMLNNFGLDENDTLQSLYNIDNTIIDKKNTQHKSPKQNNFKNINESLYISPDTVTHKPFNRFEQISENDPRFKERIEQVMKTK